MKKKRFLAIALSIFVLIMQVVPVFAQEGDTTEWYELVEGNFEISGEIDEQITPYTLYIMNVICSIVKIDSTTVGMRAEIHCAAVMKNISVTMQLQKLSGSTWVNVGSTVLSSSNTSSTVKSVIASNVSPGTYRTKATAFVTSAGGYSESFAGYSGSITVP